MIMLLFVSLGSYGKDYYSGKSKVSGGGITYLVTHQDSFGCFLENSKNALRKQEQKFEDGTKYIRAEHLVISKCNWEIIDEIVKKNIPASVLSKMRETKGAILIGARFSPKTGRTLEIGFSLSAWDENVLSGVYSIPPESFAAIEKELKEKLVFTCSREDLNYGDGIVYSSCAPENCAGWED